MSAPERFGLIGNPISHSKSPALFNAGYAGRYAYDLIEGADFETSWRKFLEEYKGINVTAPFKEDAFAQALYLARDGFGSVSGPCFRIKATNLLVKTDEGIQAHNTDFSGIIMSVAEAYHPGVVARCHELYGTRGPVKVHQFMRDSIPDLFKQKPQALIVGCGGAGKAAAVAAAEMGFSTALMNRTHEKAEALAGEFPEYDFIAVPVSDFRAALRECDLIIYNLPVAMNEIQDLSVEDFRGETPEEGPTKVILEANYVSPAFCGEVAGRLGEAGCRYVPGRNWLLYQALAGYPLMTGTLPDLSAMASAL